MERLKKAGIFWGIAFVVYILLQEPDQEKRSYFYSDQGDWITYAEAIPYPEISLEDPYVFCISAESAQMTAEMKEEFKRECFYFFWRNRQLELYPGGTYPEFNVKQAYTGEFDMVQRVTMEICKLSELNNCKRISKEDIVGCRNYAIP